MRKIIGRAEAKALGLKTYFTGKPCVNGHIDERVVRGDCISCIKLHRERNIEKIRERDRIRSPKKYIENKEKILAHHRKKYHENIEKERQRSRDYSKNNKEQKKKTCENWKKNNPESHVAAQHRQRARKRNAEGSHTKDDILYLFKIQKAKCAYCKKSIKNKYHVDHIVPLAKGGSNWPKNLQLLCPSCNNRKSAKFAEDFARELGFLL